MATSALNFSAGVAAPGKLPGKLRCCFGPKYRNIHRYFIDKIDGNIKAKTKRTGR